MAAPFLTGQAGQRTRVVSSVILPIALGILIIGILVLMSRASSSRRRHGPTPAPVATVAPTAAPTSAIPAALSQPPASRQTARGERRARRSLAAQDSGANGERIKVWREGTEMVDLGQTSEAERQDLAQVRDPDGNVGWTASDFLKDPSPRADAGRPTAAARRARSCSGGLGQTRPEWEQAHGQPSRTSIFLEYEGGRLIVGLPNENVWHLERIWVPATPSPLTSPATRRGPSFPRTPR